MHMQGDPAEVSAETCRRARDVMARRGVAFVQFWGFYPSIISTDEAVRREGVRVVRDVLRLAPELGAHMVGVRPCSMNPRGDWWPDAENYTPATQERLVRSLREIGEACEAVGVPVALECHVTTTLSSPAKVREIIEQTESSWIKVTLDVVNFISSLPDAFNNAAVINNSVDTLAPYIAAMHVKDVYVEDRHVVHISETIPGCGILDFDTLFRRYEALQPDGFAIIEHLPESQTAQATAFVKARLNELGIRIVR
jgi:sugar phosphate isomerase/epimerase